MGKLQPDRHCDRNKEQYRKTLEIGLIIALSFALIGFQVFRKKQHGPKTKNVNLHEYVVVMVDNIPVTTQGGMPRPPSLPQIPLPTEDLFTPRDETIDTTHIDLAENLSLFDLDLDDLFTDEDVVEIGAVLPEAMVGGYVRLKIMVDNNGWVDSVKVLENTTGVKAFENLAKKSAYRTRYIDDRAEREKSRWITRFFNFRKK